MMGSKRKTRPIERKAFVAPDVTRRAIEGRAVTGIFNVFGVRDWASEITHLGAFNKTFAERGARALHLWAHRDDEPPTATIVELYEVTAADLPDDILERYPEATGGAVVVREYLDTPRANDILAAIEAGVPLQMSYTFQAMKVDFEEIDGEEIRHIREVALWETSDVCFGMNEATLASAGLPTLPDLSPAMIEALSRQLVETDFEAMSVERRRAVFENVDALHSRLVALTSGGVIQSEADGGETVDPSESRAAENRAALTLLQCQIEELLL